MQQKTMRFWSLMVWVSVAMALPGLAENVTITLVTPSAGGAPVALEERQNMWKSPFGGWSIKVWPFSLRVDQKALMEYTTAEQKLMAKTMEGGAPGAKMDAIDSAFALDSAVRVEDVMGFRSDRRTSETLNLAEGRHVIHPFGMEFTLAADGTLATRDPRLRIDVKARKIEVLCYPVLFKPVAEKRSVATAMELTYGVRDLLSGLETVFDEYDKQNGQAAGSSLAAGLRRFMIYLPTSAAGEGYTANGVKFEVGAEGRVKLAPGAKARCDDGRVVLLETPAAPAVAAAARSPLGVSWFGAAGEVRVSSGGAAVTVNEGMRVIGSKARSEGGTAEVRLAGAAAPDISSGSVMLMVSPGMVDVQVGSLGARLVAPDGRWPHRHVICDLARGTSWAVETAPLEAKPGAEWSCRLTSAAGKAAIPATLKVQLEGVAGGVTAGEVSLKGAGSLFSGTLPSKPGLWRVRVSPSESSPLKGQTLGLVLMSDQPAAAVSLFTVNNRALFRRGDAFDLLWVVRRSAGAAAAAWPVRLRGMGLDATVAQLAVPAAAGQTPNVNGRLVVETAALAPGEYTATVEAEGVAGYPFRFRICQRERLSDLDIYSFNIHLDAATPYPGSPINAYVGNSAAGPGMAPYLADGDGALDAVFGAYVNAPLGPLREMFARPGMGERLGMAAAVMGIRNAPLWPESHADEARNPKHTLPENLANMRRRMALTVQSHADFPGLDGFDFGWLSSYGGYWEYTPRLDGWQAQSAAAAQDWAWKTAQAEWPKIVAKYASLKPLDRPRPKKLHASLADIPGLTEDQVLFVDSQNGAACWAQILPHSFEEWFADANEIQPGLTMHDHSSACGLGGRMDQANWLGKSHRSSVDFSEYFLSPFANFRVPAILAMDNQGKQKVEIAIQAHHGTSSEILPLVLGALGRGVDGFAFTGITDEDADGGDLLPRLLEKFGSWFTTLDPLPDVAVYYAPSWSQRIFTVLHDLARIRRPAMMVGPQDVAAGELLKYKVLLLVGQELNMPPEILEAFRTFEAKGGVILKDDTCSKDVPGRSIGIAYDAKNVSGSWGGAQAGGEGEFVSVYSLFLKKEQALMEAFAKTPQLPMTTPDTDVLISPLAGKESIICFTIDKTEIPLEVDFPGKSGRFRQSYVLPKIGELQVEKGWYVHDLLAGKAAVVESTPKGQRVPLDFTRSGGAVYLLTKRAPKNLVIQAERTSPINARLTGGLADAAGKLLADPMPFEVTLKGPDGSVLFHKFVSIGPDQPFDLPVPAMSAGARPELVVRDQVLGTTATQVLEPAAPAAVAIRAAPDLIGGEQKILAFFSQRKGPVTILLDEGQDAYRPAAEKLAAQLKQAGREARVTTWDTSAIRPLYLRWHPQKEDLEVLQSVTNDFGWAWRINLNPYDAFEKDKQGKPGKCDYARPMAGYSEMGPRLRHDADVVLFGLPSDHRAVADLAPYLRRVPTDNYPAAGGFFAHYLWSPFRAKYDCLYLACRDVAGAEAAVACLANLQAPAVAPVAKPAEQPLTVRGGAPTPLEDLTPAMGGTPILNAEFSPSGNRLFVITASYGDWLFVLDTDGKILEKRMPLTPRPFPNWFMWGRWIAPLSDTTMRLFHWDGDYQYDLTRGYISKAARVTRIEDKQAGLLFQGDVDRLVALDPQGRQVWRYNDVTQSPDLKVQREITPRALSGNRRVLLVSALAKGKLNTIIAPSVLGLDTATGKVLWQRTALSLNAGKVIPLDDRFIVVADDQTVHELSATTGAEGSAMAALTGRPDWVLQLPGRDALLIAENSHFDRQGACARVYIRSLKGAADQDLKVPGRVRFAAVAPDNQSFLIVSSRNRTLRFAMDGTLIWEAETPTGSIVRFAPDGKTVALGGGDGIVHLLNSADGKLRRSVDLNFGNNITAEKFAKQEAMGAVPAEAACTAQPPPPAPSYLKTLPAKAVAFGPNLAPPERLRELLKATTPATAGGDQPGYLGNLTALVTLPPVKVVAGTTYLVELLNAAPTATSALATLRVEISVTGKKSSKNLPVVVRLPVDANLMRRRFAFRADANDEVTVTMRAIVPGGAKNRKSYEQAEVSAWPVQIGDMVVVAMKFPGRSVLFDGGPGSRNKPAGTLACKLYHPQVDNMTPGFTEDCPSIGLRVVNGMIANQPTEWGKTLALDMADLGTAFKTPVALSVIVVYEDLTGPVLSGENSVRERAGMRYAVDVSGEKGQAERIGGVSENRNLVNIFPCPAYPIKGIRYTWGGRTDDEQGRTDGFVRMAQIEAYATESDIDAENLLNVKPEGALKVDMKEGGAPDMEL
jgi:outer membrane protein assembly factor BamB